MAMNTTNSTETIPGNGSSTVGGSPRKKVARKSPAIPAPSQSVKRSASAAPVEILFKDLPNPYVQAEPPYIWIDHPQQNEILRGPVYVIRIGIGGAEAAEISIDKSAWRPCRLTSGYWWYDWSAIRPGKHTLVARMKTTDGRWFKTPPRACAYRP